MILSKVLSYEGLLFIVYHTVVESTLDTYVMGLQYSPAHV